MNEQQHSSPSPTIQEWYAVYCGDINLNNASKLTNALTFALSNKVSRLHLLFHTWGGVVGDGIYLYNLLKNFPLEVILYNSGQIASAGTIAYLGARFRKTTANATFMIHKSHNSPQFANATKLKNVSDSLLLDDIRSEEILKQHLKLPDGLWSQFEYHDVYIQGTSSVAYGLADEISEFSPPVGSMVLNTLS